MSNEVVLKVENLGKKFKIYPSPWGRIKEWFTFGKRSYHKEFWALQDISFEVRRGGFLGIIGPNGAGKSTLLKVITDVLEPTSGSYRTVGKVLSLIELSGGLDADLSGRENVLRSAQLLGFPDGYVNEQMSQIEEFAELGEFFDRPLRVYSSGMRVRLAFSMFAFLECDVLILDEVLAVGDIFFRQKCYARLEELIKQDTAIILVTHSTGTVRQYCDDVIVLENGKVLYHGDSAQAISTYFQIKRSQGIVLSVSDTFVEEDYITAKDFGDTTAPIPDWPDEAVFMNSTLPPKSENKNAKLTRLAICNSQGNPCQVFRQGEMAYFYFSYEVKENIGVPITGINIISATNLFIHGKNSLQLEADHPQKVLPGDIIQHKLLVKLDLAPGNYIFNLNLSAMHPAQFAKIKYLSALEYKEALQPVLAIKSAGTIEVILPEGNQAVGLHSGLCNLSGEMHIQHISKS